MATKKKHWFWNLLIVLTVIVCLLAFAAHSKNWTKMTPDKLQLLSGFYYKELPYAELDSIGWVERIPPMQRLNGFSAFDKGKGIYQEFKDSLTDKKVNVYVDNFSQQKIRIVYRDSFQLYLNLKDSVETLALFDLLQTKLDIEAPN
ncbi:hypothetical protein N9954_09435 [Maribacter sp.]|nr:hypothetical protein [Maribacter sp.]